MLVTFHYERESEAGDYSSTDEELREHQKYPGKRQVSPFVQLVQM